MKRSPRFDRTRPRRVRFVNDPDDTSGAVFRIQNCAFPAPGVFDEDASSFATGESEFVAVPPEPRPGPGPFTPPTEEAAAAARKFWLQIIRRFTEPVAGKKGRVRVTDSSEPAARGEVLVEHGSGAPDPRHQTAPLRTRFM
jgi:hypothetical protein